MTGASDIAFNRRSTFLVWHLLQNAGIASCIAL